MGQHTNQGRNLVRKYKSQWEHIFYRKIGVEAPAKPVVGVVSFGNFFIVNGILCCFLIRPFFMIERCFNFQKAQLRLIQNSAVNYFPICLTISRWVKAVRTSHTDILLIARVASVSLRKFRKDKISKNRDSNSRPPDQHHSGSNKLSLYFSLFFQ